MHASLSSQVGDAHDEKLGDIGNASQFAVFELLEGGEGEEVGCAVEGVDTVAGEEEGETWSSLWKGTVHDMESVQASGGAGHTKQHKKGKGRR